MNPIQKILGDESKNFEPTPYESCSKCNKITHHIKGKCLVCGNKDYVRHGGDRTPQYYCSYCDKAHTIHKKIGKEHLKYRVKV